MSKARAGRTLRKLIADLSEPLYTNSSIRNAVETLYAVASNLVTFLGDGTSDDRAAGLPEVLSNIESDKKKAKGIKRALRRAAQYAEDLEDYADRSRYDALEEAQIEDANEIRDALHEALVTILDRLGIPVDDVDE